MTARETVTIAIPPPPRTEVPREEAPVQAAEPERVPAAEPAAAPERVEPPQLVGYRPVVQHGNQVALSAARFYFAQYIARVHLHIHPHYASRQPAIAALAAAGKPLAATIELVLEPTAGRVVRSGVVKTSGVPAFDGIALDTVTRAGPLGSAPHPIVSPDGRVYLHWELSSDPADGCSPRRARPFMLKSAP